MLRDQVGLALAPLVQLLDRGQVDRAEAVDAAADRGQLFFPDAGGRVLVQARRQFGAAIAGFGELRLHPVAARAQVLEFQAQALQGFLRRFLGGFGRMYRAHRLAQRGFRRRLPVARQAQALAHRLHRVAGGLDLGSLLGDRAVQFLAGGAPRAALRFRRLDLLGQRAQGLFHRRQGAVVAGQLHLGLAALLRHRLRRAARLLQRLARRDQGAVAVAALDVQALRRFLQADQAGPGGFQLLRLLGGLRRQGVDFLAQGAQPRFGLLQAHRLGLALGHALGLAHARLVGTHHQAAPLVFHLRLARA